MNGTAYPNHSTRSMNRFNRFIKWPLLCGLLSLALPHAALATIPLYQNFAVLDYAVPGNPPPVIDATAFDNENQFNINYTTGTPNVEFYEPMNTLFYTNNGTMMAETPFINIDGIIFVGTTFAAGFQFDLQTASGHAMADTFYNANTILCDSFGGQSIVAATNIVNFGTVDVGLDGLMKFTGQNVDLSRSTLNEEGASANTFGSGIFGLNTNFWDPSAELGPNFAESAPFPIPPFVLELDNSTAYFDVQNVDPSNNIIRVAFIEDTSPPNVSHNVYFGTAGQGFGSGNVTIEWIGSYLDSASGNTFSNFLYLNDDYVLGSSTNVFLNGNGYPDNFTFTESPTQVPTGVAPAPPGFLPLFPAGSITNLYAFANVQLISTTVSTNITATNPTGAITNLPGRIYISAANELNLALAQVTGPNYLSVQSTNQFDGSPGALIQSPYSDLNLGVTNGFLTVSNLLVPVIPNWSGNVQAWSTRWIAVSGGATNIVGGVTNIIGGVTNDFRVLIVGSQLNPTTLAQVQNLILHSTNSIVISDTFNVTQTFSADGQSLTLTTNGPGVGATSVDGELNLNSTPIFLQSSLPNLRNLTNNGAIRTLNQANFGNPLVVNVTPGTTAVAATGTLSQSGSANVAVNDKVTIGSSQYAFVNVLNNRTANQIKIGITFDTSMNNFIAAINHAAGSGSTYSSATTANTQVTAGLLANHAFTVTAIAAGVSGNSIATTETLTHLTWNGRSTLTGGVDFFAGSTNVVSFPYDTFINNGLISDQGAIIFADDFVSSGTITNGTGGFMLQSQTAVLTNGSITAGADVSITADSLVVSNLMLQTGRSLTLQVTNLLTDTGPSPTNGNFWSVGAASSVGLNLPVKPAAGDLLGTTITNIALAPAKNIINTWAATNFGTSVDGYTNNAAIGRLILDAQGINSKFTFNGIGTNNALYVDSLELLDFATNRNVNGDPTALTNNSGMIIYYAQAVQNGVSVADKLNHKNNDHLRWVPAYNGFFSSTNLVFGGTTNAVNAGLAQSTTIDSDGDGIFNANDSSPIFLAGEVNFTLTLTNVPPLAVQLQWATIPGATNYVLYTTNLASANWLILTNFVSPTAVPPVGGWPIITNATDMVNPVQPRFYRVHVDPNSVLFNGP
jgi:hypothetical protein